MLNCRSDMGIGSTGCLGCGLGDLVILLLEMGVMDTARASPKTELRQQLMQISQCVDRHAWISKIHTGTCGSIEHPSSHHNDGSGGNFNEDDLTSRSLLAVLPSDTTPVQSVPAIEDLDFLPDMGRMTS